RARTRRAPSLRSGAAVAPSWFHRSVVPYPGASGASRTGAKRRAHASPWTPTGGAHGLRGKQTPWTTPGFRPADPCAVSDAAGGAEAHDGVVAYASSRTQAAAAEPVMTAPGTTCSSTRARSRKCGGILAAHPWNGDPVPGPE